MKNYEIAKIFFEIADFMKMQDVPFKPQAYSKAALSLENLKDDVAEIYRKDGVAGLALAGAVFSLMVPGANILFQPPAALINKGVALKPPEG